jgi:O-antigen/teichoic acid export membrane protein
MIKNSFIYLITEILNKAIPFVLLPIITTYLSPKEYGFFSLYQTFIAFITPFITMNMSSQITINFFKLKKEEISAIISSIIIILVINVFINMFLCIGFYLFFDYSNIDYTLLFLIIFLQSINLLYFTILRNEKKAIIFGISQIVISFINLGLSLLLLKYFNVGWHSLVYGMFISQLVLSIYSFRYLYINYVLFQKYYSFFELYKTCFPLIFYLLGGSLIFLSDRLFIEYFMGIDYVGIYSIGNQFGLITTIIISAILMGVNPYIYENLSNKKKNIFIYLSLILIFIIIGFVVWRLSLVFFPFFIKNKQFYDAISVIGLFSFAFVIRGFYQLNYNIIVFFKKNKWLMYISLGGAITNLILNYLLIPIKGIIGAAQATLLSFIVMFLVSFIASQYLLKKDFYYV